MIYAMFYVVAFIIILLLSWDLKGANKVISKQAEIISTLRQEKINCERRCKAWQASYDHAATEVLRLKK